MSDLDEKRIFRNAFVLYGRILISVCLSLYSSRVILEALGIRDYGIYNVVGGVIALLSFLNATMSGATQRFLNFEMGRGRHDRLSDIFSSAWAIHMVIALAVVVLGETIGLWAVNNFLVIAPERMAAARLTYQFSLGAGVLAVLTVPFSGAVFAHEKMKVYAAFSLTFSILKLAVALAILYFASFDNLIVFSGLMFVVQIVHFCCFMFYGIRKFPECTLRIVVCRRAIRHMLRFSGSDMIGTSCATIEQQGILVILNRFGGTVLNAAGGLASMVILTVNQFGAEIIMSFRPQIIRRYAAGCFDEMQRLLAKCANLSILLMAFFAVPCFVEIDFVLHVWLKTVPAHTSDFCRIGLMASMSQMAVITLACGIHATGKVFSYSVITGITYLIELPATYILIVRTQNPDWAYILPVVQLTFNTFMVAWMLRCRIAQFKIIHFITRGFVLPTAITVGCVMVGRLISANMEPGWLRFLAVGCASGAIIALAVLCLTRLSAKGPVKQP